MRSYNCYNVGQNDVMKNASIYSNDVAKMMSVVVAVAVFCRVYHRVGVVLSWPMRMSHLHGLELVLVGVDRNRPHEIFLPHPPVGAAIAVGGGVDEVDIHWNIVVAAVPYRDIGNCSADCCVVDSLKKKLDMNRVVYRDNHQCRRVPVRHRRHCNR